jgi:hypothetical protein
MLTMNSFEAVRVNAHGCLALVVLFLLPPGFVQAQFSHSQPQNRERLERGVRVVPNEASRRVDIIIDGQPFTSYIWPETLMKPVLYPVRTAQGTVVTRAFPLEPRPGESVDHPHQVGLWFNYGDVNGLDFWNNSSARTAEEKTTMGRIVHRRIVSTKNGRASGELEVEMDWLMPDDTPILHETTRFIFRAGQKLRTIDRLTTLTALAGKVIFNDSKEGMLGLRVRRELEQPAKQPILLTDARGRPAAQPVLDNAGVSGQYRNSEGLAGDEVWGTRGRWAILAGEIGEEPITLGIFDHPENVGYPTYWMARGYGLFAANPLGQKAFSTEKKEPAVRELRFTLAPKHSVAFRYRIVILSEAATVGQVEAQYRRFISEVK